MRRIVALSLAIVVSCTLTQTSTTPSPSAALAKHYDVCVGQEPSQWSSDFQTRTELMPDGTYFGPNVVAADGRAVYGLFNTVDVMGLGRVDMQTGALTRLVTLPPDAGGISSMALDAPWLAWTQQNSNTDPGDWTVLARNLETNETTAVANSRQTDGSFLFGQFPLVSLRKTALAFALPTTKQGEVPQAAVHVFDLGAKRDKTIATGRVSSPVYAGSLLLWGRRDDAGKYSFEAADADTLATATVPSPLRDPGTIVYLAGSSRWFAWTTETLRTLNVWRIGAPSTTDYSADDMHLLQFLQLAGDFVLWYSGTTSTAMDLTTGNAFDAPGLAGNDAYVVKAEPVRQAQKGEIVASRLSEVAIASAGGITACTR